MTRLMTFRLLVVAALGAVAITTVGWPSDAAARTSNPAAAKATSQIKYLIIREARHMGIPASLALAVAKVESNFQARARSHKGARGIMQIMPATARGEYGIQPGLLWNPRINVRLGLHFLQRLLKRYRGRVDLALSYYNGGSAVGTLPHARVIPATRKYVDKVQRYRRQFSRQLRNEEHTRGYGFAGKPHSRRGQEF
jgi:soluble lytic murein transglycosylase-like protein